MNSTTIKNIQKKYRNQWLLIRITKMDEATTTPLRGRLLAHSPDRDVIYKKSLAHDCLRAMPTPYKKFTLKLPSPLTIVVVRCLLRGIKESEMAQMVLDTGASITTIPLEIALRLGCGLLGLNVLSKFNMNFIFRSNILEISK